MKSLSCVWLFVTPWTVACQAPPSMRCSKQECWSGLPFPSPEDLPNPGLLHCRQMLYHLSHQGNYNHLHCKQKKGNNKDQNGNYWNEGWGWKSGHTAKPWASTYRLHELKHLPLLDFLHLEDILQRYFIEMLPNQVHLAVCLQAKWDFREKAGHYLRREFSKQLPTPTATPRQEKSSRDGF